MTYTVTVGSTGGTTGFYGIKTFSIPPRATAGRPNNTQATAQNLEGSFITLNTAGTSGQQPARGAVLVRLCTTRAPSTIINRFDLKSGQTPTRAVVDLTLLLGHVPRSRQPRYRGKCRPVDRRLFRDRHRDLRPKLNGDAGATYSLVVTRNADFDTEHNDSLGTAQDLISNQVSDRRWVMGERIRERRPARPPRHAGGRAFGTCRRQNHPGDQRRRQLHRGPDGHPVPGQ